MVTFNNRVAWVTGGGRGIGRALALALAREGVSVAVSSRTDKEIEVVAEEIRAVGSRALAVRADAMSLSETRACAKQIEEGLGPVDILVNNAGGGVPQRSDPSLTPEQIDELSFIDNVDLNLFSAYRATQSVLPGMVERRWGRIINIGSGYARHSGGDFAYTAAKHGVVGLTRAMAAKVALDGVCINCLCPTWTHTQLIKYDSWTEEQRTLWEGANLQKRVLQPEELGPMAVLLASEEGHSITGQVVCVDGGDWV